MLLKEYRCSALFLTPQQPVSGRNFYIFRKRLWLFF